MGRDHNKNVPLSSKFIVAQLGKGTKSLAGGAGVVRSADKLVRMGVPLIALGYSSWLNKYFS
jgi:hypothetical protein